MHKCTDFKRRKISFFWNTKVVKTILISHIALKIKYIIISFQARLKLKKELIP